MSSIPTRTDPFKVVVVGMTCVGKSSLVQRLVQGTFNEDNTSTCGADFYSYSIQLENETIRLQIWDTAGQERFRSISKQYFRNAMGAILVFDISNLESFDALSGWLNDLHANCLPNAYVLLVGNKADLNSQRQVGHQEVKEFAERNRLELVEASALNGKGVKEAFTRLALEVSARVKNGQISGNSAARTIQPLTPFETLDGGKKKEGCC
jgi:small GTP-binding protein